MARVKLESLNEGTDEPDLEPVSRVTKLDPPVAPAPQLVTLTADQFQQLLSAAQGQGSANGSDLAAAITEGMKQVKEPIPENKTTEEISYANPLGDRRYPRSGLGKCGFYWGVIKDDEDRTVVQGPQIEERDSTIWELLALNTLEPIETTIARLDRAKMPVKIHAQRNRATNTIDKLVIGLPAHIIGKGGERNMVPDLTEIVRQVNGHDLRQPDVITPAHLELLKWLYAEHKAKRYVSAQEIAA